MWIVFSPCEPSVRNSFFIDFCELLCWYESNCSRSKREFKEENSKICSKLATSQCISHFIRPLQSFIRSKIVRTSQLIHQTSILKLHFLCILDFFLLMLDLVNLQQIQGSRVTQGSVYCMAIGGKIGKVILIMSSNAYILSDRFWFIFNHVTI